VRTYEIHCGARVVSRVRSFTPRHAVTDYLRSQGCTDDEMEPIADDALAWRGATYTAVEAEETGSPDSSRSEETDG
jgi:hypothetical protein